MDESRQEKEAVKVPRRILGVLLSSVAAGVVPRIGAPYIAIGRTDETAALCRDLDMVRAGGAGMRFIVGPYGSGKSFLLQLMRGYALDRGFVTADADLSPQRKICGTKGQGVATYRELITNMASKAAPGGGALPGIIGKWFSSLQTELIAQGLEAGTEAFDQSLTAKIFTVSEKMESEVGGFDFAAVLNRYYHAYMAGEEETKSACMRWLRGEYATKTEARAALGVGSIIDDDNWFDYIKLMAVFLQTIGYSGFLVILDECVNLYKISNRISRENNYEKLLSMFNDTLQGRAQGLMMLLGGTPQFLEDRRRGLFSYEALRSRLCDGQFDSGAYKNFIGPVIRLPRLSDGELLALTERVCALHGQYYGWTPRVTDADMVRFVQHALSRAGADVMITPREIIRDFSGILNILMQNPEATFDRILAQSGAPSTAQAESDAAAPAADADHGESMRPAQSGQPSATHAFDLTLNDIDI